MHFMTFLPLQLSDALLDGMEDAASSEWYSAGKKAVAISAFIDSSKAEAAGPILGAAFGSLQAVNAMMDLASAISSYRAAEFIGARNSGIADEGFRKQRQLALYNACRMFQVSGHVCALRLLACSRHSALDTCAVQAPTAIAPHP
jgi:hypothetical protein